MVSSSHTGNRLCRQRRGCDGDSDQESAATPTVCSETGPTACGGHAARHTQLHPLMLRSPADTHLQMQGLDGSGARERSPGSRCRSGYGFTGAVRERGCPGGVHGRPPEPLEHPSQGRVEEITREARRAGRQGGRQLAEWDTLDSSEQKV